jgi:hypothetical protein
VTAWLHRNQRSTWKFEFDPAVGLLVHRTKSGNTYAIMQSSPGESKPIWIGRRYNDTWFTCERELRARSVEFEVWGSYVFQQ